MQKLNVETFLWNGTGRIARGSLLPSGLSEFYEMDRNDQPSSLYEMDFHGIMIINVLWNGSLYL